MHKGLRYFVEELDHDTLVATVSYFEDCGYYTSLEVETDIDIVETIATKPAGASAVSLGVVEVSSQGTQFAQKRLYGDGSNLQANLEPAASCLPDHVSLVRRATDVRPSYGQLARRVGGNGVYRDQRTRNVRDV